ncbi:MAG: helix-turn-helix domain-containing protein [Xenococcus sp. MO_188.B8]|nr:helix-turn-helix domain-containing protein [Xenococcus sp. MO_188.B8]
MSKDREKVIRLYGEGVGATAISKQLRIGRSTVYKILEEG